MGGKDDFTGDCFQAWPRVRHSAANGSLAEPVQLADNLRRATTNLRNEEYSAVVLDDAMVDADPDAVDILLSTSGMAVPVYVNLALSNSARVAREVRLALRRHDEVRTIAMRAAESLLRSELRGAITGILLSTELVLKSQDLSLECRRKAETGLPVSIADARPAGDRAVAGYRRTN